VTRAAGAKGWISVVAEHAIADAAADEDPHAARSTRWPTLGRATLLGPLEIVQEQGDLLYGHRHGRRDEVFPKLRQRLLGQPDTGLAPLELLPEIGVTSRPPSSHRPPPIAILRPT
jgi:hypothetical protein